MSQAVYDDQFMTLEFTSDHKVLALRWKAATAQMVQEDFKSALVTFADQASTSGAEHLLVDVQKFRWSGAQDVEDWGIENVIPKYNAAGVTRFGYLFGPGAQLPPAQTGSKAQPGAKGEQFETRYFGTESEIRAWFAEGD